MTAVALETKTAEAARLIAAAPELLAALEDIERALIQGAQSVRGLRAAIKKAVGK